MSFWIDLSILDPDFAASLMLFLLFAVGDLAKNVGDRCLVTASARVPFVQHTACSHEADEGVCINLRLICCT